jgi:hypothetical protein
MQDPMVIIGKIIINQIGITNITSKYIIKILYFDKIVSDVIDVRKKVMSRMIVRHGKKLLKNRRTPNWKLE